MKQSRELTNRDHLPKHSVPVRVSLTDGSQVFGVVYVRQGQRILDMLCDERAFFPLKSSSGVSLVSKNSVMKVEVMTVAEIVNQEDLFPGVNLTYLKNNNW